MKKRIASLLFLFTLIVNAQDNFNNNLIVNKGDTIVYTKNTTITESRSFTSDIKEKYNGKDFEYKENKPKKKKNDDVNQSKNSFFLESFYYFMSTIFPFLLGGFVVFVILKTVLGIDGNFWNKSEKTTQLAKKLIYEDEDINELNLDILLQQAIDNKNFRLAIRYYYLSTLKLLTNKNVINYHKDKTNSEYLFEIENENLRNDFSYLSYVYSYVWYGEFSVDEDNFKMAQNKYQSFFKSI